MSADYPYNTVLLPMTVSVYLNYQSPYFTTFVPARTERAYLAGPPLPADAKSGHAISDRLFAHDIYENLRDPPYRSPGERSRLDPKRSGIYVHWSLPALYRNAMAAADTGTNIEAIKKQAGYPASSPYQPKAAYAPSRPSYRPVPNRWFISGHVTPTPGYRYAGYSDAAGDRIFIKKLDKSKPTGWQVEECSPDAASETFVVLSDRLRDAS